jgi:hypothetical protein
MSLEEAYKIRDSLIELDADEREFNWGPALSFARERKEQALAIINKEIDYLQQPGLMT